MLGFKNVKSVSRAAHSNVHQIGFVVGLYVDEQDITDVFSGGEEEVLLRFSKYANEDLYYSKDKLSRNTGGLSNIKAFRRYLHEFIEYVKRI